MVVSSFKRGFAATALCVAGFFAMGASPVLANTSATTAELPAQVRNADTSSVSSGDENFKQLFAQWEALDGSDGDKVPAPVAAVSIPSRMPLAKSHLTSNFGMREHPVMGGRRRHKGVDLAAPTGTPVYATADGIVSKAERFSSYGLYVSMEHGAHVQTRFAHMSRIAVAYGQKVKKGDIIGYVGSTGRSTGPHLHYEIRIDGKAVNPVPYMVESKAQKAYALAIADGGRGGE